MAEVQQWWHILDCNNSFVQRLVEQSAIKIILFADFFITLHYSMLIKKDFSAAYYVNSLPHMGNRTSNRVESVHANIKRHTNTSSGSMVIVTEKIGIWMKKRV